MDRPLGEVDIGIVSQRAVFHMMESYKQNKSFYSELKCQKKEEKNKNGFLFSRKGWSGETIPTADNTREKEDKFNTAYVYTMNERNSIPGIPFGSNILSFFLFFL